MALTTLPLRLLKMVGSPTPDSLCFRSLGLGLMILCLPGCGPGGNAGDGLAIANPGISLSPTSSTFTVTQGDTTPVAHTVTISNSGNGTLGWGVSTTAPWLSLSPNSGTASSTDPGSLTATVNSAGLAAGTYSTTITVSGSGATNTPESLPVTLTISAPTSTTSTSTTTTPTTTSTSTTSTSLSSTSTANASLTWSAETDPSVLGYYVHYGTQSPNSVGSCAYALSIYYSLTSLSDASLPTVSISGLATDTTYYFAVSAYNGLESPCSAEVVKAT